ncbi:PAS domain-containing protein [Nisaea acidiphila]|uniref:PAS domain-containing protein n=1 Tax=Nisaea acidiphila TaxID=1862145 RepID=A0A9J7AT24_9PROT|nr:PAS domain-containing protein [Nisaea acidiphila]UUX49641.1 PAS domain-containing protein [Nisaea acidiphila]
MNLPSEQSRFIYASVPEGDPAVQKLLPDPKQYSLRNYAIFGFRNEELDSDRFIHPQHRCLTDWFAKKYQKKLDGVHFREFDPLDVKPALGSIVVLEPTENIDGYRYRLYGSQVVDTYGLDLTGRTSGQLNTEATRNVRPQYQTVARNNFTIYTEHDKQRVREPDVIERWDRWSRLILPLVDEEKVVRRVLVCMVPTEVPFNSV